MPNNELDLTSIKNTLTIANAMEEISKLEDNNNVPNRKENLIKWKNYAHQVVIETGEYFYKIYEAGETGNSTFTQLVRTKLAEVYESLGIHWKVVTFEKHNKIYSFQQRQKLKVASKQDTEFTDIFLSFSRLLDKVEEMLEFEEILRQIKTNEAFSEVAKLKLLRTTVNKYNDYAIYNGQAILLDDAEFFIALVNKQGQQLKVDPRNEVEIAMPYGNFLFCNTAATRIENAKTLKHSLKIDKESNEILNGWFLNTTKSKQISKTQFSDGTFGHHYNSYRMSKSAITQHQQKQISENIEATNKANTHQNKLTGTTNAKKLLASKPKTQHVSSSKTACRKSKEHKTLYLQLPSFLEMSSKSLQLSTLKSIEDKLKGIDPSEYSAIQLAGEPFFNSQIKDTAVLNEFITIVKTVAALPATTSIKKIVLNANLNNGLYAMLYKSLDAFEDACISMNTGNENPTVVLLSNLNGCNGLTHGENLKNWKAHMQNINAYYPWLKKETIVTVNKGFIELYLNSKFAPEQLMNTLVTSLSYKLPNNQQLFAKRSEFRKFLIKYAKQDPTTFAMLTNMPLISEEQNEKPSPQAHNSFLHEINPACLIKANELKHTKAYALYPDCNCCTRCDIEQIWENVAKKKLQSNKKQSKVKQYGA